MRLIRIIFFITVLGCGTSPVTASERPNFVVILADDLGFSDVGCYGGEIATPQLDALAANGLRYTQFYNTARCWPTRGALLTGYYAQQIRRDALPELAGGSRGRRPAWARLLPEILRPMGYRSYHAGKWHVDGGQLENGFDRSYSINDHDRFFSPRDITQDDEPLPAVEPDSGYYATTAIVGHAIRCLREHAEEYPARPFFQYVAFNCPHFPLQALPEDIARDRDRYRVGWDEIRAQRWQRMRQMQFLPGVLSELEPEIGPPYDFPKALRELGPGEVNREVAWTGLTKLQCEFQAAKMAIHAAMVARMDQEIGRLLAQLRAMSEFDNTLVFFLSDNGASAEIMIRGDGHDPSAPPGSAASYLCLGPGWSSAANTPFRRHKTWVHEGGIATPLIVHWPAGISAAGQLRRQALGHVIDLAPTIVQLAGGSWPTEQDGVAVPPTPGCNLSETFADDVPLPRDTLWWLHEGNRAVRIGDWKLVAAKGDPWELYDLAQDRSETYNRAAEYADRVAQMQAVWNEMTAEFRKLATQPDAHR